MKPLDLMEAARGLTELNPRRPSQANLRRAVSTAYHALFHCLAACAANTLIGRVRDAAWHQTYRARTRQGETRLREQAGTGRVSVGSASFC